MKIALIMDNPQRDLGGMVLLAAALAQRGATCYLVPINLYKRELWALAPDFVLLTYLRKNNQDFARDLMDAGMQIGVLDTEGGVVVVERDYANTVASDAAVRGRVACYCTWGSQMAVLLPRYGWYRPDQLAVTGSPRYDFYVAPWRAAARAVADYTHAYPPPLLLINSSFPLANPRFGTPEQEGEGLRRKFGYSQDYIAHRLAAEREGIHHLTQLANRLAGRFPQATLIYRPHPFERLETYADLLERRDNLHLAQTGTVDGWILSASAVIQRGSSTAIDANIAGVPVFSPDWYPPPVRVPAVEAVSVACESAAVLEEHIERVLSGSYTPPEGVAGALGEIIARWFHAADGLAHQRVAAAILERIAHVDRINLDACRERVAFLLPPPKAPPTVRARLKRAARRLLREQRATPPPSKKISPEIRWDGSAKHFDAARVEALIAAIRAAAPGQTGAEIGVAPARERGDYHFGYDERGRSVAIFPR